MKNLACTKSVHEAIKADARAWAGLQYIGRQYTPADEYGPAETLELRNCACGSTLAIEVAL